MSRLADSLPFRNAVGGAAGSAQLYPFRCGDVEIQMKLVENRRIKLSLGNIKIHVVEGITAERCPIFQDRGEVTRLRRRVLEREINPVSNDGQVIGIDALLIADVTRQISVVHERVGNLLQQVARIYQPQVYVGLVEEIVKLFIEALDL